MILLIISCGLLVALLITNAFIYLINKIFHHFNYHLTGTFYYLLSSFIVAASGLMIGWFIIWAIPRYLVM